MKSWRVYAVLLSVVILLGVILGVKIMNNTPEKQSQEILNSYNEKQEKNKNEIISGIYEDFDKEEFLKEMQKDAQKRVLKQRAGLIVIVALIGGFLAFCNVKVCAKLGIEGLPVILWLFSVIASFLVIFTFNERLSDIVDMISGILSIILLIMQYKVIGVNPWLLLLAFIPIVGIFAVVIVFAHGQCKLGEYFGKGTAFQLGLIFLPFIFIPILAFSEDV